jgi:demethylmenaquinone methyltransferase/2-methoxy-6-polyprenyl-1,4-benzoquinol methylase
MVDGVGLAEGSVVLDVAAGTGSISRELRSRGFQVISADQSQEMTRMSRSRGGSPVLATAEHVPFQDAAFDGVTFGYLLRYVDDVSHCMGELARVVRPGGVVAMVEFGQPTGPWYPPWWLYTRTFLPLAGAVIGSGWRDVGRFLGPSIEGFAHAYPPDRLVTVWELAGLSEVRYRRMSLGGGLIMWGRRR